MSAISSVGACMQPVYLQKVQQNQNAPDSSRGKLFADALQALGVNAQEATSIENEIQQAVKDAVGTSTDRRAAVQQDIEGVLKQHGIDPAQFKAQLKAAFQKIGGRHRHHHAVTQSDASGQSTDSTPKTAASATTGLLNTVA